VQMDEVRCAREIVEDLERGASVEVIKLRFDLRTRARRDPRAKLGLARIVNTAASWSEARARWWSVWQLRSTVDGRVVVR